MMKLIAFLRLVKDELKYLLIGKPKLKKEVLHIFKTDVSNLIELNKEIFKKDDGPIEIILYSDGSSSGPTTITAKNPQWPMYTLNSIYVENHEKEIMELFSIEYSGIVQRVISEIKRLSKIFEEIHKEEEADSFCRYKRRKVLKEKVRNDAVRLEWELAVLVSYLERGIVDKIKMWWKGKKE